MGWVRNHPCFVTFQAISTLTLLSAQNRKKSRELARRALIARGPGGKGVGSVVSAKEKEKEKDREADGEGRGQGQGDDRDRQAQRRRRTGAGLGDSTPGGSTTGEFSWPFLSKGTKTEF